MDLFAKERQEKICGLLEQKSSVTVNELVHLFGVSIETVRRDLFFLEQQKCLKRVHGGAVALGSSYRMERLDRRMEENMDQKRELSCVAARLIQEGDVIAVDAGSTAAAFAQVLKERFRTLTVITHSLDVFQILSGSLNPILCGGEFMKSENAFFGELTCSAFSTFHVAKTFLFPSAVSVSYGIMDYILPLIPVQKAICRMGDQVLVLADSGKFETTAMMKVLDVSEQMLFITDSQLPPEIAQLYREKHLTVLTK